MFCPARVPHACSVAILDTLNDLWRTAGSVATSPPTSPTTGRSADDSVASPANRAVRESEERLRLALDLSGMGTWEWDPVADIVVPDAVVAQMLGMGVATCAGNLETFLALVHAEDRERVRAAIRDSLAQRTDCSAEYRVVWPDGSTHHLATRSRVCVDQAGRVVRMAGVCCDVTGQRQAEQEAASLQTQMQQVQKMEAVGRLAAGVAHDFNNLLTVILGHAEMSLAGLNPDLTLASSLRQIAEAGGRARELTQQILTFGRGQPLQASVVDLNNELASIGTMLRRLIGEDVRMETILAADLGQVRADRSQVQQVIMNLVVNARDAMPGGGKMVIETANVVIDAATARAAGTLAPGPCVALSVSDTGCGMDAETLSRIFEPFFTTKELGRGTGLGLATVYGIVRQHEGHIQVESRPGVGTRFTVLLRRLARAGRSLAVVESPRVQERGSETILLVEDDPPVRKLLHLVLTSCGYDVVSADSPHEALALARGHHLPIRLLLTDVVMPDMSGCDLYRVLREEQKGLAVLYISGYAGEVVSALGVLERGTQFLQKPFRTADLTRRIREVLQRHDRAG